ncbi:unnamed protein product [Notodromas monacha]|uniref:MOB kinase activator-like 2 n=1 Tax=Notodromas monacha TaxID=399045 RepID=A0A7R9BQC6_9CRUS|nr:unnamed protein product [Notodromas monacha]CAG0918365.1 unnamed protein product [Notodromas monacha]
MGRGRRKERSGDGVGQSAEEQKLYLQDQVLERKLTNADLRTLTVLPAGLDYNEWLASHTIAFFNHVNLIYGTISEYCTISGCPEMTGPGLRQYLWFDEKGKKTKVAAPQYIDYVMTFVQKTLSDESIFPTKFEGDFPASFESLVKKILGLLFHVIAHLYHGHFKEIVLLNLHSHLNCLFAHLILFNHQYRMIDDKETNVLEDLVVALQLRDDTSGLLLASAPAPAGPTPGGAEDEDNKENCDTCNIDGASALTAKMDTSEEQHSAAASSEAD